MILYAAADLLWASKIKGTAESIGLAARPVRTLEMLDSRLADSPVKALVVDLELASPPTPGGVDAEVGGAGLDLIRRLRSQSATASDRAIRILAFGPHVATDLLEGARRAGADHVMPRGAFAARMPEILRALGGHEST